MSIKKLSAFLLLFGATAYLLVWYGSANRNEGYQPEKPKAAKAPISAEHVASAQSDPPAVSHAQRDQTERKTKAELTRKDKDYTDFESAMQALKNEYPRLFQQVGDFSGDADELTVLNACLEDEGIWAQPEIQTALAQQSDEGALGRQKQLIERILVFCREPGRKDMILRLNEIYQHTLDTTLDTTLENLRNPELAEQDEDLWRDTYRVLVEGALGPVPTYVSSLLRMRLRQDKPLLLTFLREMHYGQLVSRDGTDYIDPQFVDDAIQLIRCNAYPQECAVHSALMNSKCLYDDVACELDFVTYLHYSGGTQRFLSTYGIANFTLTQAGYPALEVPSP